MKELIGFIIENLTLFLIIGGVGLAVCGIVYALFFKKINELIVKYKEVVLYLIFGVLTTLVNFAVYTALLYVVSEPDYMLLVNNAVAWLVAVVFAFVVNKWIVFGSKTTEKKALGREILSFVGARVLSLVAEEIIFGVFVVWLGMNDLVFKIVAQIVVIVMNYIFSKLFIFKK